MKQDKYGQVMNGKETYIDIAKTLINNNIIINWTDEDDIGYVLIPFGTGLYFKDKCAIYAEYTATKEDCDFIGQVDLREAYQKIKEK